MSDQAENDHAALENSEDVMHWIQETDHGTPALSSVAERLHPDKSIGQAKVRRQLFNAIEDGDEVVVEEALQNGANADDIAPRGMGYWAQEDTWTALHRAIKNGYIEIVRVLLEYKANPDLMPPSVTKSALHVAISDQSAEYVELLLQYHANPNITDDQHRTPLDLAIADRQHQVAMLLLSEDSIRINLAPELVEMGHTKPPIHEAITGGLGWIDVVQKLLKRGASVESRDTNGQLAIHYASKVNSVEVIGLLLEAGASPNVIDAKGRTPLYMANSNSYTRIDADETASIRRLIEAGALPNAEDSKGRTPVFKASKNGHAEAVEALIGAGALVQVQDTTGRTPLHYASANNHREVVCKLIVHGADPNATDWDGMKPLHDAMLYGAFNAVDQLFEHGATPTVLLRDTHQMQIEEPSWNKLLCLPSLGHHKDLGELTLSSPEVGSEEKLVSEGFRCALWPWDPAPFVLAMPTVDDLLYGGTLNKIRSTSANAAASGVWIHLPANNVSLPAIPFVIGEPPADFECYLKEAMDTGK